MFINTEKCYRSYRREAINSRRSPFPFESALGRRGNRGLRRKGHSMRSSRKKKVRFVTFRLYSDWLCDELNKKKRLD